jgi:ferrous iron transport protein B
MKKITIALVGQPNVGKSMLTNSIGNATLHVGNFTGVTVEKKEIDFKYKDYAIHMVDLPGTYMLADYSQEEKVTSNFLKHNSYDMILNIVDSTNLERNLQLTSELLNLDKKMVVALNMSDEAKKEGIDIDAQYMSELLGVDAVKVSALTKEGISTLLETITKTYEANKKQSKLVFSATIEQEISNIVTYLQENKFQSDLRAPLSYRKIAIDLISENKETFKLIHNQPIWMGLQPIVLDAINHIKLHHNEEAVVDIFAEEFMAFNKGILTETVKVKHIDEKKLTTTQKIDNILIHPLLGLPIFLFFMWSLFQLTFELGSIPMDYIDAFFGTLGESIGNTIQNDELRSLMVDGIIAGVGAVVMFVPNIMILFIGIALLEGTGYMSRVAYLLDGFFHRFGLHGQSFIPLVTGFGCSIPAYMSARILKNDKDRLITLFIIGFMSCGAKLPVYVLFTGAFFAPEYAGNILFIIYISGALLGLVMAKILKMTAFKGSSEPFVMEMPKYRMPSLTLIGHTVKSKTWMYLKKAGTFIAAASMLVWFLSNYPKNSELESLYATKIEQTSNKQQVVLKNELSQKLLEQSYLGIIGKTIEPIFAPLGMDWKMAVALQTGLAAKEVVVSTLGVLYSLGDEVNEENTSLVKRISQNIPFASAVAFIIIVMIYLPCLAATIVFSKEAGGWRYAGYLFVFTSIVAYGLAFIGYLIVS